MPFSTLHFREDPDYWAQWFPADFITESFPGQFRNWFYSMLAMSTVLRRERAVQDDLRLRPALRRGRPADAQDVGQRDRVRRGRRADGRRRHALDVRQGAAGGQHPLRLARRRRGAPRAARALERLRVLRDVRAAGRLDARRAATRRRSPSGARSTAGSCRAPPGTRGRGRGAPARLRRGRRRPASCRGSSTTSRPGTCACRASGCARNDDAADRAAAFATLHEALLGDGRGCSRRSCRSCPRRCTGTSSPTRRTGRTRVHLTRWPAAELAGHRDARLERAMDGRAGRGRPGPDAAQLGPDPDPPAAGPRLAGAARPRPRRRPGAARDPRRRDQRQAGRGHRRRLGPRRAARQAAAAEDRQAAGRRDPGRHGRGPRRVGDVPPGRLGDARRRDPGTRRGRDPGHAAARHGGRRPRRAGRGHRHRADPGAARRGRRPRAAARRPGPAPRRRPRARRPDRPVDRRRCAPAVAAHLAGVLRETLATLADGPAPADATARATVELESGSVAIALRRRVGDG